MRCVKYFSKKPANPSVKRFSAKNGTVKRFSTDGELSLSGIDPDKFYLYKDSNVNIPGFAIDKGDYIVESSKHSRGYKLTKAYGPFDTPAEAETFANTNAVSLINSEPIVDEEPAVATMSADDSTDKIASLESKVEQLSNLVADLVTKLSAKEDDATATTEEPAAESESGEDTPVAEETEETPVEETTETTEEPVAEDEPETEETEDTADTGEVDIDLGLGEQVPANTNKVEQVYTQVPEEEIVAQFSTSGNSDDVVMTSSDSRDSMFNCLYE